MSFRNPLVNMFVRRAIRSPLALIPREAAVPILSGPLIGKRWIVGSAIHRCWMGVYEHEKQKIICRKVRRDMVFWDVGANVGFYSLLASALVGRGRVFAFEPAPRNLFYLKKHIELNRITNVEVLPLAVGDHNGTASFEIEETGFMGRVSESGHLSVSIAALDWLVAQGKVLPPDCVKMDIEGAEFLALRGATAVFQSRTPVLFLATHGHEIHGECCRLLESWGYRYQVFASENLGSRCELLAEICR